MTKQMSVKLNSVQPLLMNCNQGVDPLFKFTKQIKEITSKRKKTDEDHEEILHLKWLSALYYDDEIGPYIPAENVEACLREAAKKSRRGKDVVSGIRVVQGKIPLEYDGPREPEEMYQSGKFRDFRVGRIQRASVNLCRPRFNRWSITFDMTYEEDIFSESEIEEIFKIAGKYMGLCDYRPRYGTFEAIIQK